METKSIVGPFASGIREMCTQCGVSIFRGAPMFRYKNRRTKDEMARGVEPRGLIAIHESCFQAFAQSQRDRLGIDWIVRATEQSEMEDTPVTPAQPVKTSPVATQPTIQPAGNDLASIIAQSILPLVQSQLEMKLDTEAVQALIDAALSHFKVPVTRMEVYNAATQTTTDMGLQHKQFPQLLKRLAARNRHNGCRLNHWITGSAGTGKTSAVEAAAKALGLTYAFTGSISEEHKVLGYVSPGTGNPVLTAFLNAWENGGVFLFDDFDGSDPIAALGLNTPLAGQWCVFPDGRMVKRHVDCVLVLTANTWGYGATNDYVGRLKQDGAFLDRFVKLHWEIDEELELAFAGDDELAVKWTRRVQQVRRNVAKQGLKVLVTPRATFNGIGLLDAGVEWSEVEMATMGAAMTPENWAKVR